VIAASPLQRKYGTAVDRQSAYEILSAKLAEPPKSPEAPREPERAREPEPQQSMLERVLESKEFQSLARSAASTLGREITRSIFGTARRGRR
jgi:hypothetical protein